MTTSYVALLRGINVGGTNTVDMADLRILLGGLGCGNVRTHLNSGNVIFTSGGSDSAALARKIEAALAAEYGFSIRTLVRSREDLKDVVKRNPMAELAAAEPAKFTAVFFSGWPKQEAMDEIDPAEYAPDRCELVGRVLYAYFPDGLAESKLTRQFLEKRLDQEVATARNWNTLLALLSLMS
ncbi:MAG TPA: DUF1697 domain-containing protein [Actinocrinis sp.]|nr:DUF1697 domain-containing protein [Actinocrinis sp.]